MGDNKNVITWAKHRKPGNRVAKYFVRILNRLGNENNFTAIPMYISTLRNKIPDELSRLPHDEALAYGAQLGMMYRDCGPSVESYLGQRTQQYSLVLPPVIRNG